MVGNGTKESSWDDNWVGNQPLALCFPRVFEIFGEKELLVFQAWEEDSRS